MLTEENGIKCKIDMSGEFAGRLTISAAIKSDEDTTVFQSDISDSNTVIAVNNIEDNTEYNFVLTVNNEVYNGKLMRCLSDDNYYYAVEGYEIFTVDTSGAKDMYATGLYAKRSVSATPSITFSLSGTQVSITVNSTTANYRGSDNMRVQY